MSELDIIRAWKDKTYRNSLSDDELALLPEHPAGAIELTNDELAYIDGVSATPTPSAVSVLSATSVVSIISVVSAVSLVSATVSYFIGTGGSYCCKK